MARGWESKSVESQIEETDRKLDRGAWLTPEQRKIEERRAGLELSRRRVLHEIEEARSPVRRASLEQALAFLDEEIGKLGSFLGYDRRGLPAPWPMSTLRKPPAPPPIYDPHAKARTVAQPRTAAVQARPGAPPPPPLRWPGQGPSVQAKPAVQPPASLQPRPPVQPRRLAPPPVPPPRTARVAQLAPAPRAGFRPVIQCKLGQKVVNLLVTQLQHNVNLVYDDANPDQQQLEENYRIIAAAIRGAQYKDSEEHVKQVAKALSGKKKPKNLSFLNPIQQIQLVVVEIPHLEDFPKDEGEKLISHDPEDVSLLAKIDGGKVKSEPLDDTINNSITTPDNSSEVTTTVGDGEVASLASTLSDFVAFLKKPENQTSQHHFTVALVGPYGPCNGCKKRIIKFVELWQDNAKTYMRTNVNASLTITYKYANRPQKMRNQYYGYPEDAVQNHPYLHTLTAQATGTNAG